VKRSLGLDRREDTIESVGCLIRQDPVVPCPAAKATGLSLWRYHALAHAPLPLVLGVITAIDSMGVSLRIEQLRESLASFFESVSLLLL